MRIIIILILFFLSCVSVFAQQKGKTSAISAKKKHIEIVFSNGVKQICDSYEYLKVGNENMVLVHYTLSSGRKVTRTYPRAQVKSVYMVK